MNTALRYLARLPALRSLCGRPRPWRRLGIAALVIYTLKGLLWLALAWYALR